jgi:hypothetical protein
MNIVSKMTNRSKVYRRCDILLWCMRKRRVSKGEWVLQEIENELTAMGSAEDPLEKLSELGSPTGDIEQILAEIEAGRS